MVDAYESLTVSIMNSNYSQCLHDILLIQEEISNQALHPKVLVEETMSYDGDTNVVKEKPGSCEGPKNSLLCFIMRTKINFFFFGYVWRCVE